MWRYEENKSEMLNSHNPHSPNSLHTPQFSFPHVIDPHHCDECRKESERRSKIPPYHYQPIHTTNRNPSYN
jgi:hypothetical protein